VYKSKHMIHLPGTSGGVFRNTVTVVVEVVDVVGIVVVVVDDAVALNNNNNVSQYLSARPNLISQ